jgi:hypothetical protein
MVPSEATCAAAKALRFQGDVVLADDDLLAPTLLIEGAQQKAPGLVAVL